MSACSCVRIYAFYVENDFRYKKAALSVVRREKIDRIKSEEARNLSAAADMALDYALSETISGYRSPPDLSYDAMGRPRVPGTFISLSHTRGLAACAIADCPVGLDAEWVRPLNGKIARRVLASDELTEYAQCADKPHVLLTKWVAKEAYLKLTGAGLAGGMSNYAISQTHVLDALGNVCAHVAFPALEGFRISVCCREKRNVEWGGIRGWHACETGKRQRKSADGICGPVL